MATQTVTSNTINVIGQAKFSITQYPTQVSVQTGQQFTVDVQVQNIGDVDGTVELRLRDHNNNIVDSKQQAITAGSSALITLTGTAPSQAGSYTWTIEAYNVDQAIVDDSKTFTLNVSAPPTEKKGVGLAILIILLIALVLWLVSRGD